MCQHRQGVLWHSASILHKACCQYAERMDKNENKPLAADADKFIVRLPSGMRERIAEAAKANNRSMNAEIVARIQHSFAVEAQGGPPDMDAFADQLAEKLAKRLKGKGAT